MIRIRPASATSSMSRWNGSETRTGVFVPECRGRLGCTIAFGLTGIWRPSASQLDYQSGSNCCYAGHGVRVDRVRPAIIGQMEQRIAADQGDVTSARAMDVTGFAGRHKSLGRDDAQRLTGADEFSLA